MQLCALNVGWGVASIRRETITQYATLAAQMGKVLMRRITWQYVMIGYGAQIRMIQMRMVQMRMETNKQSGC